MTTQQQAPAVRPKTPLAVMNDFITQEGVMGRFKAALGERGPQFVTSLMGLYRGDAYLQKTTPQSTVASALIAATLDLPIEKNLGFAFIIPYGNVAQFQIGYKGLIQLAMRTGQYARMNAVGLNAECVGAYDDIGERAIDWTKFDETKPAVGYFFGFKMVNGFTKTVYRPREWVEAHAKRYSQAYKAGKKDSPWFTNFDAMALKTIIKLTLSKWGILSVQMQKALAADGASMKDLDGDMDYQDGTGKVLEGEVIVVDAPVVDKAEDGKAAGAVDAAALMEWQEGPKEKTHALPSEPPKDDAGKTDAENREMIAETKEFSPSRWKKVCKAQGISEDIDIKSLSAEDAKELAEACQKR